MSYFFCNFANIYIQTITKSNKMDINIFTPPSLSENISLGNITEGRVAIATPPKPI